MTSDLLLTGGTLVTARESFRADILVRDGRIAAIGQDLEADCETRAVTDRLVMPGGIDTHVHLEHRLDRLGITTADDFASGTTAAACGGVTTIIDFALQRRGESIEQAVARRMEQASRSVIDYSLHVILTDVRDDVLAEMPRFIAQGYTTFKIFTTFGDKRVDDAGLFKVLEQTAIHGGLAYVHCENDGAVQCLIEQARGRGETGPSGHSKSRPPLVEAEAAYRAIALAEMVGAPVFIAHVTSRQTLAVIEEAQNRGACAYCETCPQYLTLTEDRYDPALGFEAAKYVCTPPLRPREHLQALWEGLRRGSIHQVSSDHSAFRFQDQKQLGKDDFTLIPNGLPGIETRLPLLFSEGVRGGRIPASRFVELVAANPARIFGLYPKKGSLSIGADADLAVIDPETEWVVDHRVLHQSADYSPYDGMKVRSRPVLTVSRGEIIFENGEPRARAGRGRFVPREPVRLPPARAFR